jgi:uncharacterized LabA/DUF88 family protein
MEKRINDGGPAFPQPYPPQAFEGAMVFVDGTNLFYRLQGEKLVVSSLFPFFTALCSPRQLQRAYVYTSKEHLEQAKAVHGSDFLSGCRVVLGDSIPVAGGNFKEKGVDALLVADLVYHAASKNCQFAFVVTQDTDFCYALRRVEDFGCRTAVVAVGAEAPDRLRDSSDHYIHVPKELLVKRGFARAA